MTTKEKTRTSGTARPQKAASSRRTPDVIYTQPKPFRRNRFILHIATVVAVVLALVFGMAIFFKVEKVEVAGAEKYSAWDIKTASGIQDGDQLLTLNKAKISGKIITELPYVKSVRIAITLPDTVKIEIEELSVFYAIETDDAQWYLIAADGKVVEKITEADAAGYTKITGVKLTAPVPGQPAVAAEEIPEETTEDGQTVPPTVLGSEQLSIVLTILQELENNGILGKIVTVDVSDIYDLQMTYGQRFQILLGDASQMQKKISEIRVFIDQCSDNDSGELDASYTTWPDGVGLTPFS